MTNSDSLRVNPDVADFSVYVPEDARALLFDLDGTLADTMPVHYRAWTGTLSPYGYVLPEDKFYSLAGIPTGKLVGLLNAEYGWNLPVQETAFAKEARFESDIGLVTPVASVVAVVRAFSGKLPMAVATGGNRNLCGKTLAAIGLTDAFGAIVTSEDVVRGKPAPDVFLEAARRLGVEASACVVFEDADLGIKAAFAAGMRAIDVRKSYNFPSSSRFLMPGQRSR